MPLRYLSIPICSLCRSLNSLVSVHNVLNAFEISKYTYLFLCRSLNSLVTVHKVLNAFEISKYTYLFFMSVS